MDKKIYKYILDGEWRQGDERVLKQYAPAMLPFRGVFETLRTYDKQLFLFDAHLDRAEKGLNVLGLSLPVSKNKLSEDTDKVIKASRFKHLRLRLSFWFDKYMHYAIVGSLLPLLTKKDYDLGFQVMFVRRQREETTVYAHVKSLDYEAYLSAYQRAQMHHFDEALLVNQQGHVYEGSRTNVFIVKEGCVLTSDLSSGCLNGITRQYVMALMKQHNIDFNEVRLTKKDVLTADEVFITNSTLGIMPVSKIEDHEIAVGSLTQRLMMFYEQALPLR